MPAPAGNQYALGNQGGRPQRFDKKIEGEELLKWAMLDTSLVLRMFAPMRGYSFDTMIRWAEEDEEFRQLYNMAKEMVGARREIRLIEDGSSAPFQRYATFYDKALQMHEREEKSFESSLKQQEIAKVTEEDVKRSEALLDQLDKLQNSYSDRKIASNSTNKDQ